MDQIRRGARFLCPAGTCGDVRIHLGARSGATGHRVAFNCPHVVRCTVCGKRETQLKKRLNATDRSVVVCLVTWSRSASGEALLSCHHKAKGRAVTGTGERMDTVRPEATLVEADIAFLVSDVEESPLQKNPLH